MLPEQEGAYIRLLCHAWGDPHCSLPAGDDDLAILSRLGPRWQRLKAKVLACFVPHPEIEGRFTNEKLYGLWLDRRDWQRRSSAGGKRSGEARRAQREGELKATSKGTSTRDGSALEKDLEPKTNIPSPLPLPSPKKGDSTWLTRPLELWQSALKGTLSAGKASSALKPVRDAVGDEELCRRLEHYLAVTPGEFASVHRFAETHGQYACEGSGCKHTNGRRSAESDHERRAAIERTAAEVTE
jgi:uncharacterized protein YdaU (DUF1376 family)